jgi:hypothetical protein
MKSSGQLISEKIARITAGGRPRVLDLFAGCGGLLILPALFVLITNQVF